MEYYEFRSMNSAIVLAGEGDRAALEGGFEQTRELIESLASRFTRFSETSELSALNRSAGEWAVVSSDLYALLWEAAGYVRKTRGLFDPAILPALVAAGYDRSIDEIRKNGGRAAAAARKADRVRGSLSQAEFDWTRSRVRVPERVQLDLGGIAKGWIAERAAQRLAQWVPACAVSAGGDMRLVGLPEGLDAWPVEIEDPREPERTFAVIAARPGAVATSSVVKRVWRQGDQARHHLIDPRTGEPARTPWLSVTAIAEKATTAEVYAKALLVAGPDEAREIAAERQDLVYIAIDAEGEMWGSPGAEEYLSDRVEG